MANTTVEERLTALELEMERLKKERNETPQAEVPWWKQIWGTFKDDEAYAEAMRLGREYRESLRPEDNSEEVV